jgi:hypothetical protein
MPSKISEFTINRLEGSGREIPDDLSEDTYGTGLVRGERIAVEEKTEF